MSMSKKDFIALADEIKMHNQFAEIPFAPQHIGCLARVLGELNPRFNEQRWIDYIEGKCGPNGGTVKSKA